MPRINNRITPRVDKTGRLISLVTTTDCNLECSYCYEKHENRNKKIMDVATAKEVIRDYMKEKDSDYLVIDFFGGEPLLAFDFIRDIVDWFNSCSWKKECRFQIGTNGTVLKEEMKEWLYKNREQVKISLSIDGTKKAHDLCRSNSYDHVNKNLPFFLEHWPHQPAKMTICADTIPFAAEGVIHLEEMNINFTANVGFDDFWGDDTQKKELLEIYEEQLATLVDYYLQRFDLYPVAPLLTSVPEYLGIPILENENNESNIIRRFCGAGHEMVVVDVDGERYPCHRFIPWISGKPAPGENANCQTAWKPDECSDCILLPSCPTCAGFNWEVNNDSALRTTFHCNAFKLEVKAACLLEWKRLQLLLNSNESIPDEKKGKIKIRLDAIGNFLTSNII